MKRRNTFGALVACAAAMLLGTPVATAQSDPTAIGGGKKPYVLVVIDSSGSMEYTDDGDGIFPFYDRDTGTFQYDPGDVDEAFGDGNPDTGDLPVDGAASWVPGDPIFRDPDTGDPGPRAFGSCFAWDPVEHDDCRNSGGGRRYERPSWRPPTKSSTFSIATSSEDWYGFDYDPGLLGGSDPMNMTSRLDEMRGSDSLNIGYRLQPETQPRHVTIKEVLTGDMIMLPLDPEGKFEASDWNATQHGPGCWFVPRQRYASVQPTYDQEYCLDDDRFEQLPDHEQPIPHIQEAYDLQVSNGVLDRLGSNALFAFAAFDGYRDDTDWDRSKHPDVKEIDDAIGGEYPPFMGRRNGTKNEDVTKECNDVEDGPGCYNLGLWRIVTPTDLQVPSTMLPELSAFVQIAINDTGYLTRNNGNEFTLDPDDKKSLDNAFLGAVFPNGFKDYVDKFSLGKQPIARATPIAAAIHDARQFFRQVGDDKHFFHKDNDPFAECRPKHVVLLTDGKPEPEWGDDTTLNEAFGYDLDLYSYHTSEMEIGAMLEDPIIKLAAWEEEDVARYNVRVHIAGLSLDNADDGAIGKMARMAMEGNSCAEYHLPNRIPDTHGGPCTPGTGCLVDQSGGMGGTYDYTLPNPQTDGPTSAECNNFPALILDNNSPSVLSEALFQMFSEIIAASGLASRTRLVVTNRLDDSSIAQGGQYRFYSGVRIGGAAWWKGVINRNTLECGNLDEPEAVSLDDQVGTQVEIVDDAFDSRRVWTAVPDSETWDFVNRQPQDVATIAARFDEGLNSTYVFSYGLSVLPTDTEDEFGGTYVASDSLNTNRLLGSRVPFEHIKLDDVYGGDAVDHMNTGGEAELQRVVNTFRARIEERVSEARGGSGLDDRVIGGILNSNPVTVEPPNLDLPIGSYRNFRALYADRPTMLYVSSMDGILHALHTGRLEGRVKVREKTRENELPMAEDANGDAENQREAWAYLPFMLHRDLVNNVNGQAYLVDGSPIVKDVRLCNKNANLNQNRQACRALCAGDCFVPGDQQWRTVLVQGRGQAGAGYYAVDVTRPGGLFQGDDVKSPDPILLWEFDRKWERAQVEYLYDLGQERGRVALPDGASVDQDDSCNDTESFWKSPLLGTSISEPELATILVEDTAGRRAQRPVAVFGGGSNLTGNTECGANASGMAIYVVDLQSGTLLRRFTYYDDEGIDRFFGEMPDDGPARFVGSPALYDASAGSVATRGFIGDERGRLFKMNFTNPDPNEWEVTLFFDPNDKTKHSQLDDLKSDKVSGGADWGPAAFKPAIALNADRDVMVVYGLGEVGDTVTNGQAQAVLALTENRSDPGEGFLNWAEVFPDGEKVTGAPIVFDRVVYFPTYSLGKDETDNFDACEPGSARIWGLTLTDQNLASIETTGVFAGNAEIEGDPDLAFDDIDGKWFGPKQPTLIRGLTVTLGPICSVDFADPDNPVFSQAQPQPQLLAQTSADVSNSLVNPDMAANEASLSNSIKRMGINLQAPRSQSVPLSWEVISN